jgi:glycosyltransferase involved in cell wall biosynthesis
VHVLYVIDSLAPGGAESSLAAIAPHYAARGVRLDVGFFHDRPGVGDRLQAAGAGLHHLGSAGGRIAWARRARGLVRSLAPDLVHTTLFEADVAGRVAGVTAGVPVVSSLVNPEYGPEQFADPRLKWYKLRAAQAVDVLTARGVRRFHSISRYVADVMAPRLLISRRRVEIVPRGRDPRALGERSPGRGADARARIGISDDDILVFAAARQEHQKGLDILLEAFARVSRDVPEARLVIAGREGDQSALLRESVTRLGLTGSARFLGARPDVLDLICAAEVFVAPSRWEGLGSVLLEAMGLEAPIVASDLPAIGEMVRDGESAILVPPEDPVALGDAITSMLRDRAHATALAAAALEEFRRRFTIERVADQMVSFYEAAVATRS